jgi:hypothetical protein
MDVVTQRWGRSLWDDVDLICKGGLTDKVS